jgi:hypothetical protein
MSEYPCMTFQTTVHNYQITICCLELSRGYAFVTMDDPQDALMCVKNISGRQHLYMMMMMIHYTFPSASLFLSAVSS